MNMIPRSQDIKVLIYRLSCRGSWVRTRSSPLSYVGNLFSEFSVKFNLKFTASCSVKENIVTKPAHVNMTNYVSEIPHPPLGPVNCTRPPHYERSSLP